MSAGRGMGAGLAAVVAVAVLVSASAWPATALAGAVTSGPAVADAAGTAGDVAPLNATFDAGPENWTVAGDAQGAGVAPDYVQSGGDPGGHLCANDDVSGGTWYFAAPSRYLGDRSAYHGGTLSFVLKQSATGNQFDQRDILLHDANTTLSYDFGNASAHPGTNWTAYAVPLSARGNWTDPSGAPVTDATLRTVLSNLTALKIRGEYKSGSDRGCLDDVSLAPGDAPDWDAAVADGGTFYVGQVLGSRTFAAGTTADLRRGDGTLVTAVPVRDDGTVLLATAGRSPGTYELRGERGQAVGFDLVEQTYEVTPNRTAVTGEDGRVALAITSNRDGYRHVVTSPALDAAELAGLFPGLTADRRDLDGDGDADALVVPGGSTIQSLVADFGGLDPDDYALSFSVADADASDTVSVTVSEGGQGSASFASSVVQAHQGQVATIPVTLTGTTTATLSLGSEDVGYVATVQVRDGDGDGAVTVAWDTAHAGHDPGAAFSTTAAADSVRVDQATGIAGDKLLAATAYPMALSVGGTETGVGTVSLLEGTTLATDGTTTGESTTASDGAPGFGAGLALLALGVVALAGRRR